MMDGAAIRKKDGSGIRFSSTVSDWLYNFMQTHNIEFGTIFASEALRNGEEVDMSLVSSEDGNPIAIYVKSDVGKWTRVNTNDATSDMVYRAAITGVPDTAVAYEKRIAGRSVMTITYDDGTVAYFYSDFDKENIRSMYDVATNLGEEWNEDVIQHIKDTVGTPTTPADPEPAKKPIDIYIIAGQSNGAGYTNYDANVLSGLWSSYSTGVSNVKYIGRAESTDNVNTADVATAVNEVSSWTNAKAGQGKTTSAMGAEVGMASYLSKYYYTGDKEAGIIKFAHGGTSLLNNLGGENAAGGNWVSPSYAAAKGLTYTTNSTRTSHSGHGGLYMGLLDQIEYSVNLLKQAGYDDINIKGVFWMQGESDRSNPDEYEVAFKYFVSDLRRDVGEIMGEDMSDLAIIIGEISSTTGSAVADTKTLNAKFITKQNELAAEIDNVYTIESGRYEINWLSNNENKNGQDAWHWTTIPMFRIGEYVGKCIVDDILK